jgi:hypothetical protein
MPSIQHGDPIGAIQQADVNIDCTSSTPHGGCAMRCDAIREENAAFSFTTDHSLSIVTKL